MSETYKFPLLNHTNYAEWSIRMEAILVRADLWDLVTGDEVLEKDEMDEKKLRGFRKRQATCKAEMVLKVDDSQLAHMNNADPKAIWDSLAKVHRARGFGSRLQLRRHFITATMTKDQTIESWIGEVRTRARRLESIEVKVSDEDVIVVLTAGLPISYTPVVISFDAVEPEKLTLDFVVTRLLNEEARQTSHSVDKWEDDENTAMRAEKLNRFSEKLNKVAATVQCYYCLELGHFSSSCPVKLKDNKAREDAGRQKLKDSLIAWRFDSDEESENYAI